MNKLLKKLLSSTLAVAMLLSVMVTGAWAEEPPEIPEGGGGTPPTDTALIAPAPGGDEDGAEIAGNPNAETLPDFTFTGSVKEITPSTVGDAAVVYVDGGKRNAEKEYAAEAGVTATGTASDTSFTGTISADTYYASGIIVDNGSTYTISDSVIDLTTRASDNDSIEDGGTPEKGAGSGIAVRNGSFVTIENTRINTVGAWGNMDYVRGGVAVGFASTETGDTVVIRDSELINYGDPEDTSHVGYFPAMVGVPMNIMKNLTVSGQGRSFVALGDSTSYLYNTYVESNGWAAICNDMAAGDGLIIYAVGTTGITTQGGYGIYSDTNCADYLYDSTLQGADFGAILSVSGILVMDSLENATEDALAYFTEADRAAAADAESVIAGGRNAIMTHSTEVQTADTVGTITLKNTAIVTSKDYIGTTEEEDYLEGYDAYFADTDGAAILVKSSSQNITLENVTLDSYTNTLIEAVVDCDGGGLTADQTPVATTVSLKNVSSEQPMKIVNYDYQRPMSVTISGAYDGSINYATKEAFVEMAAKWNAESKVVAYQSDVAFNGGVSVKLAADAVWTVSETSTLTALTMEDGAQVIGTIVENADGTVTVYPAGTLVITGADTVKVGESIQLSVVGSTQPSEEPAPSETPAEPEPTETTAPTDPAESPAPTDTTEQPSTADEPPANSLTITDPDKAVVSQVYASDTSKTATDCPRTGIVLTLKDGYTITAIENATYESADGKIAVTPDPGPNGVTITIGKATASTKAADFAGYQAYLTAFAEELWAGDSFAETAKSDIAGWTEDTYSSSLMYSIITGQDGGVSTPALTYEAWLEQAATPTEPEPAASAEPTTDPAEPENPGTDAPSAPSGTVETVYPDKDVPATWAGYQEYLFNAVSSGAPDKDELQGQIDAMNSWDDLDTTVSPWDMIFVEGAALYGQALTWADYVAYLGGEVTEPEPAASAEPTTEPAEPENPGTDAPSAPSGTVETVYPDKDAPATWEGYQEYLFNAVSSGAPDKDELQGQIDAMNSWDDLDTTVSPWDMIFVEGAALYGQALTWADYVAYLGGEVTEPTEPTPEPEPAEYVWTSSDESIATVVGDGDKATVTGVAPGTVTITVTYGEATASKTIEVTAAVSFPDVSEDMWYAEPINAAAAAGIVNGYDDGTFQPNKTVTRAEAAKMIAVAAGLEIDETAVPTGYTDCSGEDVAWALPYIAAVQKAGYMKGIDETSFDPNGTLTRAQLAVLICQVKNLTSTEGAVDFPDVPDAEWYASYIAMASAAKLVQGHDDGKYAPLDSVTRAQFAQIVYKMYLS